MRRCVVLPAGLAFAALAGCGGGHEPGAPFAKAPSLEAGGRPVLASGPSGATLRFIEQQRFGLGIVLRNRSDRPVTMVDARTVDPLRALVYHVGTRLVHWNPPPCPDNCPALGFLHGPYGAARRVPLTVAPGQSVGIQLNFRLGDCRAVPFASTAPTRELELVYRFGEGELRRQTLPLRSARLRLRGPAPSDCLPGPHSAIAVDGPFASSSTLAIPGSDGDTCTRTAGGGLVFRSRLFQLPDRAAVRVVLRLPRLDGPGLYRTLRRPARALGPARALVTVGAGSRGWTTFRASVAVVTVRKTTRTTLGGRFHASLAGPRGTPFRAWGAWRCMRL